MPAAPSSQLFPAVVDASTLGQRLTAAIYLPIGLEGQADNAGDATVGVLYSIARTDQAVTKFGTSSRLTKLVNAVLSRGAGPVLVVVSKKGSAPTLGERQASWSLLESDPNVRLRLTDSTTQADLAGLATSAANADLINHKQIAIVGMPFGTTKSGLITAAGAIAAASSPTGVSPAGTRAALVGPGVYDESGAQQDGGYGAAAVACEIAKNGDPGNDLDLFRLPFLTSIELDSAAMPLLREKVVAGVAVNDFEDLLQAGVSPLGPSASPGGVQITHLRTVYTVDTTHDALMTRIIEDQIFIEVRDYLRNSGFLSQGNTDSNRKRIESGVAAVLHERISWISPLPQPDQTLGYNVTAVPSLDQRQVTVSYNGEIVRGIQTIQVAGNLTIRV